MNMIGAWAIPWPKEAKCVICGEYVTVRDKAEQEWCALGWGPFPYTNLCERAADSYWTDGAYDDTSCSLVGGSEFSEPTLVIERLDAHRLTLDYNGGRSDGKSMSEQWLLEGEYWKSEDPQKEGVWVTRLDKI